MTIIDSVRNFFAKCPYMEDFDGAIGVETLGSDAGSYSLHTTPDVVTVKKYITGAATKQFSFVFASREFSDNSTREKIEKSEFFENLSFWLEQCTRERILPDIGEGRTVKKIEATTPGYVMSQDEKHMQYQIQCKLIYHDERKVI